MPVTPTYPGIYIEEILSNSHTITAAPTSVTVFRRLHTPVQDPAAELRRGRRDLQLHRLRARVRWAVRRRLARRRRRTRGVPVLRERRRRRVGRGADSRSSTTCGGGPTTDVNSADAAPSATPRHGIVFTGREPVDGHHALTVSITNLQGDDRHRAGSTSPTSPSATATAPRRTAGSPSTRRRPRPTPSTRWRSASGRERQPVSSLVERRPPTGGAYPTAWPAALGRHAAGRRPAGRRRSRPTAQATSPTPSSRTRPWTRSRSSTCC